MNRRSFLSGAVAAPVGIAAGMAASERYIHYPGDGGPLDRKVFVDGDEVEYVFYADTRRGIVRHYTEMRVVNGEVPWREVCGRVVVKRMSDTGNWT